MRASALRVLLAPMAAAVMGGAVLLLVLYASDSEHRAAPDPTDTTNWPTPQDSRRLAFFPRERVRPEDLPMETELPPLRPSQTEPGGGWLAQTEPAAPSWSVETSREAPRAGAEEPQRFTAWRLPWQSPRAGRRHPYYTLKERLAEIAPGANLRLAERFAAAQALWPPAEIVLVAIKDERALELHARPAGGSWKHVHRYRVLAASGGAGPKLRQGDRQVPEGLYAISFLNPNSQFHVSLRVNYPNAFDRQMAAQEGRRDLGGDIMIHGKDLSAGCLAVGDAAAEELFVLAAYVGLPHVKLIIAPTDFRRKDMPSLDEGKPVWLPKLYAEIATAMADLKAPPPKEPAVGLMSLFGVN